MLEILSIFSNRLSFQIWTIIQSLNCNKNICSSAFVSMFADWILYIALKEWYHIEPWLHAALDSRKSATVNSICSTRPVIAHFMLCWYNWCNVNTAVYINILRLCFGHQKKSKQAQELLSWNCFFLYHTCMIGFPMSERRIYIF